MDAKQMHHPDLPGQTITVSEEGAALYEAGGWVNGPSEDELPTPVPAEPEPLEEMRHPALGDAVITVTEAGGHVYEEAGWQHTNSTSTDTQASEAATVPGSDGGQAATTDTDTESASGTEEEEGPR